MKIDDYFNRLSGFLFGTTSDGDRKLYLHSQNLNEDRKGNVKGLPWEGRLWLKCNGKHLLHFSWNLWTHFCGAHVEADHEDGGTLFHCAFPPVAFWLSLPIFKDRMGYSDRNVFNVSVHDWALWWQFGGSTMSWHSRDSKWKRGNFNVPDFFLGRTKYTAEVLETKGVQIPMPEGLYPATAKMERCTWKRPRWFPLVRTSITLDIPQGIPHEGKGESDYDCGKDGLFGCGVDNDSYEAAIAHAVEIVLKSRRKYDGNMYATYPDPAKRPPPVTPAPTQGEASA